ncbi:MAG: methionyl-tRNA formyltransferase [Gloeomargarita sp. SKYBB_i_bin120]|nr:methionyl-tRNA formyltransferase [Gloeomargarita sp. SKYB120]MDW8178320.1 methionyl-tRNA formyltransferase [Gloeomargarita sp. SKYBB_i_bin120]
MAKLRVVFFGTPDFAVPTLTALLQEADIQVLGVVTQPDQPQGRGQKVQPSPVKQLAQQHHLPCWQPERLRRDLETQAILRDLSADAFVVVAYGQILPPDVLAMPRWGCINGHASLLPKYRGAAPIQWALYHGETETGVTTMQMDVGMDTGPILLQRAVPVDLFTTLPELWTRLAQLTAELLVETLHRLPTLTPLSQDDSQASYAPLLRPEHYVLDWRRPALALHNQVRGFYPECFGVFRGQRVKVLQTIPLAPPLLTTVLERFPNLTLPELPTQAPPGTVVALVKTFGPVIATGEGHLLLQTVQPAGKRVMAASDWVNGLRLEIGEKWAVLPPLDIHTT